MEKKPHVYNEGWDMHFLQSTDVLSDISLYGCFDMKQKPGLPYRWAHFATLNHCYKIQFLCAGHI